MSATIGGGEKILGYMVQISADNGVWWLAPAESSKPKYQELWVTYWRTFDTYILPRHEENLAYCMIDLIEVRILPSLTPGGECMASHTMARAEEWPSFNMEKSLTLIHFLLMAFVYGGLHCLAWNSHFPLSIQQSLWRIASVGVMSAGLSILISSLLEQLVSYDLRDAFPGEDGQVVIPRWRVVLFSAFRPVLGNAFKHLLLWPKMNYVSSASRQKLLAIWRFLWSNKLIGWLLRLILFSLLLFYVFARVYLVVECFIQLFHLEPGPIFEQPSWPFCFPHFG